MKRNTGIRLGAIVLSSLLGSAIAQVDVQTELEICKGFCTMSKKQCERDQRSSLTALLVADAIDQNNTAANRGRSNDPASMAQLPTIRKPEDTAPRDLAVQQCESDRLQCAQDCAQPKN